MLIVVLVGLPSLRATPLPANRETTALAASVYPPRAAWVAIAALVPISAAIATLRQMPAKSAV